MTAPTTTGPASGPLPASSIPQISLSPLLYNSVSIFTLIDNVDEIIFNFSGNTYKVSRNKIRELYPNYNKIGTDEINQNNFNKYLENKMNDNNFIKDTFNKIFM